MEKWFLRNVKADLEKISKTFGISKLLSKVIVNRNIIDYKLMDSYINPSLSKLHNPKLMKDIELGVYIIKNGIDQGSKIRIVGDYDQDGNSAILTLYNGFKRCGANIDYVIPHRIKDGYGINEKIIQEAKDDGVEIIITCDNGISAFEPFELAKELGITVIITDHHDIVYIENEDGQKEYKLPEADAIVNPKRIDCNYPFKELCGAGVAFKFVQVLYDEMDIDIKESYELLEYVAMGTVCDVVDLIDENRIIVKEGLKKINNTKNLGLKALIKATGLEEKKITTYSLGFILGPCINSSGRLDSAEIAVELFLTDNLTKAEEYANKLHMFNEKRKKMTIEGYEKVIDQVDSGSFEDSNIIVLYETDIHESIAGIIAGRVKDKYYKPTIVLTQSKDEEIAKGSGRSIKEYNMFDEISKCKDLLSRFGGHPMAAGLSLNKSYIEELNRRLNDQSSLKEEELLRKIYIDAQLPLDFISFKLIEELELLEPFGKGNSKPLFAEKNIGVKKAYILGKNKNVLKLMLEGKNGKGIEGIYFGDTERFNNIMDKKFGKEESLKMYKGLSNKIKLDIVYTPSINEYMGNRKLQIVVKNYR